MTNSASEEDISHSPSSDQPYKQSLDLSSDSVLEVPDRTELSASQIVQCVSDAIAQLYRERLGQSPEKVDCDLLSDRLVIWIEGSITSVDQLLFQSGDSKARSLCFTVDKLIRQYVITVIEAHLQMKVATIVADTCYQSGCTGLIVKLSASPAESAF